MNRNLLLAFALSFLVLSLWSMWQEQLRPPVPQAPPGTEELALGESPDALNLQGDGGDLQGSAPGASPRRFQELPAAGPAAEQLPVVERGVAERVPGQVYEIATPLYIAEVDTRGGMLSRWELREYTDTDGARVQLTTEGSGPLAATPFLELGLGDLSQELWTLDENYGNEIAFSLRRGGVTLLKRYAFDADNYAFRLGLEVINDGDAPLAPRFLVDWPAEVRKSQDFVEQSMVVLHDGDLEKRPLAGLGSAGFLGSLTGSGAQTHYDYPGEIDWAGVQSAYFLSAVFPDSPIQASARVVVVGHDIGAAEVYFDPVPVPPGQSAQREFRAYLGPKESERLEAIGGSASASIDLGWSWFEPLTHGFSWLLNAIYSVIPNYGVAIILLTILVRAVTAPLTIKQMRSMERMRRVQPKLKEIQEKHKDDRQKQSEAMMALYKQEGVNPLGGCLPMVLQLPVFIGLFYALRSSIHLRQAPFFGWIDDLSAPDMLFEIPGIGIPLRVLPLIMGASMVLQQKITPMQADPAQARMMMTIMPIMMTVLFYQFPSGLVLYWMLSNLLAIGHQLWIGRNLGPTAESSPKEAKPSAKAAT